MLLPKKYFLKSNKKQHFEKDFTFYFPVSIIKQSREKNQKNKSCKDAEIGLI